MRNSIFVILMLLPMQSQSEVVTASWYDHGKITASGERFDPEGLTVAHRALPFGTRLKLRYKGRKIIVRVNDRGPFVKGRQLDVSRRVARILGMTGVHKIEIRRLR